MNPTPEVAIVVVSYNTRALLLECLASVADVTQNVSIELVVVDNASGDGSYEAVCEAYPKAISIRNSTNVGFAAACNQGIRATTSPFVLLLNSDARLTTQGFQCLRDCLNQIERCGAAGCRLINAAGIDVTNTRNFLTPLNQAIEMAGIRIMSRGLRRTYQPRPGHALVDCSVDWIDGACLILRRPALDEVGLFDERFFMYSEDEDLCFRLRQRGWVVCFCGAGSAIHHGGASSEPTRLDMLRHFYLSQVLFLSKHRGRSSVFFYAVAMKTVLALKRFLHRDSRRRQLAWEQLTALKEALCFEERKPAS
jgi:N-acetylglucosaminyl-diphospho-decaprenol L-rhamnosyltransferase